MAQLTVAQTAFDPNGGNVSLTGVTAGNMLVYAVVGYRFFAADPVAGTPSGGGATWTQRAPCTINNNGMAIFVWTGTGTSGGTVTMSLSGGTYDGQGSYLIEVATGSCDFDQGAAASGTGTAASSGNTAALQDADDLILGFFGSESQFNSFAMGGGATEFGEQAIGPPDDYRAAASYLEATSASAQAATATNGFSTYWVASVCALKTTGGGATGQPIAKRMGGVNFMGQHGAGFVSAIQRW